VAARTPSTATSAEKEKGEANAPPFSELFPIQPVTGPAGLLPCGATGNQPPQTWVTLGTTVVLFLWGKR
jgi:hypothetical protein